MSYWNAIVYDAALTIIKENVTKVFLNNLEIIDYTEAVETALGSANYVLTDAEIIPRGDGGRVLVCPKILNGITLNSGIARYYILTNGIDTVIAIGTLSFELPLDIGDTWTTPEFNIIIPAVT